MARRISRILLGVLGVITIYLIFGILISRFLFPASQPNYANYFQPGDKLVSRFEGFDQTVLAVNGDWMHTRLEVRPNSPGPPEHFHEHFTENFTVKSGTLSILINGEKRTLRAGETVSIPPMTDHKPFNKTNETVIVESDDRNSLPVKFGYFLSQMYGFMDSHENGPSVPQMLMQLSVYGDDADSWIANGPPLTMQKAMRVAMEPTARLLGYTNYYEAYRPSQRKDRVAKLVVTGEREILLDGRKIALRDLENELRRVKESGFVLWYHREQPEADPTPEMAEVMKNLMDGIRENRIPARMFLRPDFSE